ncbi:hypothetical protein [Staphylospora marina]|uniref:hypothetical protein n=1 Tax=Staphylospora marina TaxID=2490858 RepID=UPI000F5BA0DC|nr:hypothetical protein [Staphylospora marina]
MLEQRPKWRRHVHFAPTENGVYFHTWNSEFALKGKGLHAWVERLALHFTGEKTLKELTDGLGDAHRRFVLQLTEELFKRGVLTDGNREEATTLSPSEKELYDDTLAFLELHAEDAKKRFLRFRLHRPRVAGSGKAMFALVRSLVKMGVKSPVLPADASGDIRRLAEEWAARDPAFSPVWQDPLSPGDEREAEPVDGIIFIGEWTEREHFARWSRFARERGIPFLPVTIHPSGGWVGPLESPESIATWQCARDRFTDADASGEKTVTSDLLLGNIGALEWLKHVTGAAESDVINHVMDLSSKRLETVRRRIHPSPLVLGSSRLVPPVSPPDSGEEPEDQGVFLDKAESLTDPRFGVLLRISPGDLMQIPLPLIAVTTRIPGAGKDGIRTFVGAGETVRDATETALREALTAYARELEAVVTGNADTTEDGPVSAVWSHGRSRDEWAGSGLLRSWIRVSLSRGNRGLVRLNREDLPDGKHRRYLKMLDIRYGRKPELWMFRSQTPRAVGIFLTEDGNLLAEGAGRTFHEALERALPEALRRLQLAEHHPEFAPPAEAVWFPREEDPEADRTIRMDEPVPDWAEWLKEAERFATQSGFRIRREPWTRDPFPAELGVWVGQVGWEGGNEP